MKESTSTRREFIKKSAAATAGLSIAMNSFPGPNIRPVLGANEKIRVGFIGVGNRGSQLLERFMIHNDVEVVALADVYEPYLMRDYSRVDARLKKSLGGRIPRMQEKFSGKVERYKDFRKLLERKDIDAVCIATPDHWHALITVMALDAGKDIYVEKPLTITLKEGRKMVEAAAKTNRVVQVGLNRRGSTVYRYLAPQVQNGKIGKVVTARAFRISNMYPRGIGKMKPENPPRGMNWDMWVGPRSYRPYQYNMAPYYFRWWSDFSTQMGNWGVHYMDAIRWLSGETAPNAITAVGGKYVLQDDRTIPDTMDVVFEFKSGMSIHFAVYEASSGAGIPEGEVEIAGTKGTLRVNENGYKIIPSRGGQFQDWKNLMEPEAKTQQELLKATGSVEKEDITVNLIRNFLDCVKSRKQPWCPLEDGHRSTSFAHLANIALKMKTRIEWDADNETITNSKEANDLLFYDYRKPWHI